MAQIAERYPPPPFPPPGVGEAEPQLPNRNASIRRSDASVIQAWMEGDDDDDSDSEETSDGIESNPSVENDTPNHCIALQTAVYQRRAMLDEIASRLARPGSGHWSSSAETDLDGVD